MGEAFITRRGGFGGGLNFRVLGGTSAPTGPKENDIWINTDKEVTGYIFSATDGGTDRKFSVEAVAENNGKYIDSNGALATNQSYCVSGYTELPKGTESIIVYNGTATSAGAYYEFCDKNKNRISLVNRKAGTATYEVPQNTAYVRLTLRTSEDNFTFTAVVPYVELAEGMVSIFTGTSSPAEFNALKKNGITVYPISAKQYVSGAWVEKTAKSYQNGAWVDWILYFLNGSNLYTDITGGWVCKYDSGHVSVAETRAQGLYAKQTTASGAYYHSWYTKNKIDVTNIKTLYAKLTTTKVGRARLGLHSNNTSTSGTDFSTGKVESEWLDGEITIQYDVSNVTGSHYIKLSYQNGDGAEVCWSEVRYE